MIKVRVLRVDMRANDPKVIQDELQEQIDTIGKEGYEIYGEIRPLPSPNSALQYFIVTCGNEMEKKVPKQTVNDGETFEEGMIRKKKDRE